MTAVEARNEMLWNSIPLEIRNRIKNTIEFAYLHYEPYKIEMYESISHPDTFKDIPNTMLRLKGLGYGVEYIDGSTRSDGTDSKLIISW